MRTVSDLSVLENVIVNSSIKVENVLKPGRVVSTLKLKISHQEFIVVFRQLYMKASTITQPS